MESSLIVYISKLVNLIENHSRSNVLNVDQHQIYWLQTFFFFIFWIAGKNTINQYLKALELKIWQLWFSFILICSSGSFDPVLLPALSLPQHPIELLFCLSPICVAFFRPLWAFARRQRNISFRDRTGPGFFFFFFCSFMVNCSVVIEAHLLAITFLTQGCLFCRVFVVL